MSKLFKDTHVYVPCPACGKVERVKLKWAQNHKSLKCDGCKGRVDLGTNPARDLIARTGEALADYEAALDTLHAEAEDAAKVEPQEHGKRQARRKAPGKQAATKKRASRRGLGPREHRSSL